MNSGLLAAEAAKHNLDAFEVTSSFATPVMDHRSVMDLTPERRFAKTAAGAKGAFKNGNLSKWEEKSRHRVRLFSLLFLGQNAGNCLAGTYILTLSFHRKDSARPRVGRSVIK